MEEREETHDSFGAFAPVADSPVEECEVCGATMFGLHCKLVCSNCGYRRDCSDP